MSETVPLATRLALAVDMYSISGFTATDDEAELLAASAAAAARGGRESALEFLVSRMAWDAPSAELLVSEDPTDYVNVVANLRNHHLLLASDPSGTPFVALRSASEMDEELLQEIVAMFDVIEDRPANEC